MGFNMNEGSLILGTVSSAGLNSSHHHLNHLLLFQTVQENFQQR